MLAIKTGTQTFSNTPQNGFQDKSKVETISAADQEKYFGDQDLGQILNKVADPNYVDPSKIRKVGSNELGKESFMKLLLAQLKNQDPTSPMESHDMAAQLAQSSSLESLKNIDSSIQDLSKSQNPNLDFDALKLIGKSVESDSSKVFRNSFEDTHDIEFGLMADAEKVNVKIKDAAGNIVKDLDLGITKKGQNKFAWNGQLEDGSKAKPGDYRVEFSAVQNNGQKLAVGTKRKGTISGVNFTSSGAMLMIGKQSIRMSDVKTILDPNVAEASNKNVNQINKNNIKNNKLTEEQKIGASSGGLSDIAMSKEMINKVKKEGVATDAL